MREELAYCVPLGIPHSEFLTWDESDQDKALMYQAERASICGHCGTRQTEWDKNKFAYIADVERCPGCELMEREQENIAEMAKEGKGTQGLRVFLRRPSDDEDEE